MIETWHRMFDDEEYLESRTFPILHKTVLGLSQGHLQELLHLTTSFIDNLDADGRIALSWAAAKGDGDAVRTSLEFGADRNVFSKKTTYVLELGCAKCFRRTKKYYTTALGLTC